MKTKFNLLMLIIVFAPIFPMLSFAGRFDASYYDFQKRNQGKWQTEDKQINSKLGALEKKFEKKPNLIYILTDDIGWGDFGWQGGGKHRGALLQQVVMNLGFISARRLHEI